MRYFNLPPACTMRRDEFTDLPAELNAMSAKVQKSFVD